MSLFKTDLIGVITLWNVNVFSSGKKSKESTLILAKLLEEIHVIPIFTPIRYPVLL